MALPVNVSQIRLSISSSNPERATLEISEMEMQLIILALSRTLKDSEENAGAQTIALRAMETKIRELFHQWQAIKSRLTISEAELITIYQNRESGPL